jgi:hypothetical protein
MFGNSLIYFLYNANFRRDLSISPKILFLMALLHESTMKIKRRSELTILIIGQRALETIYRSIDLLIHPFEPSNRNDKHCEKNLLGKQ